MKKEELRLLREQEIEEAREAQRRVLEAKIGKARSIRPKHSQRQEEHDTSTRKMEKEAARLQRIQDVTQRKARLQPEPTSDEVQSKSSVQLRIKLPNGDCLTRNFRLSDLVEQIALVVELAFPFLIHQDYLILSHFPRTVYTEQQVSLKEAGITSSMYLVVELA